MKPLSHCIFVLFIVQGVFFVAFGQELAGYKGVPWNSPFPVIEHHFPGVEFVEEDGFDVTLFQLKNPEKGVKRVEFKLFKNQLISVTRYYTGSIDQVLSEQYLQTIISGLGLRKEVRKTTANSLAGRATVQIFEYADILVLFRYYPSGNAKGFIVGENSIVIIYKPTFDKMIYHKKHSEGDVEEIVDYDYIEF